MRLLLFHLRPSPLAERGLAEALRARLAAVEARSELEMEIQIADNLHLADDTEQELYRVAQEALNNVLHHANAQRVSVSLSESAGTVQLTIADDGDGFDPSAHTGGLGLPGIHERIAQIGGSLRISSAPGQGTRIEVEVPG
jgi:signal transduction histidine kinase